MKIEGIFLKLIVFFMLFTACSEEKEISVPTEPVSISFAISSGSSQTKAATEAATEDELYVSRFYLGIYDAKSDELITEFLCPNVAEANAAELEVTDSNNGKNLYTIKNLSVPIGTKVKLLAIANYPEDIDLKQSYSNLANSITKKSSLATFNFDPKTLIKTGTVVHTFTVDNRTCKIDLYQLAAKIHVKLTMEESAPSDPAYSIRTSGGDDVLAMINNIIAKNNGSINEDDFKGTSLQDKIAICSGSSHGFDIKGVTEHKGGGKWMVVKCDSIKTRTVDSWRLEKHKLTVNNIAISSPVILDDKSNSRAETANLMPAKTDYSSIFKGNIIELTFYTYQKESDDLMMVMTGDLQKIKQESSCKKADGIIHAKWNASNGWGQGNVFEAGADQINFPFEWSDWTSGSFEAIPGADNRINGLTYEIPIKKAGGILMGNYYDVKGTVKQSINSLTIDVKAWSVDDVPVHFN